MRVADTSALYAVLVGTDAHHAEARDALADPEPVLVPAEVWAETIALVQYRHGHVEAVRAAEALRRLPHLEVQPTPDDPLEDLLALAGQVHRSHQGLSPVDSVVVAWCRKRRLDALAFDRVLVDAATA